MAEAHKGTKPMVWVKDKAGNEYICAIEDLQDPKKVSEKELENCIDDATAPFTRND